MEVNLDKEEVVGALQTHTASDQVGTTMNDSAMPQSNLCCPRGHPLTKAQAKDARGKGSCDGCSTSVGLEDHIEFCVQISDQAERFDCNFYLCAACVSSRADGGQLEVQPAQCGEQQPIDLVSSNSGDSSDGGCGSKQPEVEEEEAANPALRPVPKAASRVLKSLESDLRYSSDVQEERKRQGRDTAVVDSLDTAGTRRRPTRCQHPVQQRELHMMEPVNDDINTTVETD